jgi:GntR family transcriptional repressor for pyruvate dehydrogenase complex
MSSFTKWEIIGDFSRASASSAIAARLLEMATSGELPIGTALPPERELALMLRVSRATLREAIHELSLKGLVSRRQGSGTVILGRSETALDLLREMTAADRTASEVVDFRSTFEPEISSLAAARRTESDMTLLAKMCDFSPEDVSAEESFGLDQRFHLAVAAATQNRLIVALGHVSSDWVADFRKVSHSTAEGRQTSLRGHRLIATAIAAADSPMAASHMRDHINEVGRIAAPKTN